MTCGECAYDPDHLYHSCEDNMAAWYIITLDEYDENTKEPYFVGEIYRRDHLIAKVYHLTKEKAEARATLVMNALITEPLTST